jgi:hypothetical protein
VERMLQGNRVGAVQDAPGEEPALGNLSRAILMTRDRGGSLRQAKSLIEFRQAAFQQRRLLNWTGFSFHGNKFSRNAGPTPRRDKTVS